MNAATVAVDLAKSAFQLAVADTSWRIIETHRLTRTQFERWFANRQVSLVIMEACGSAQANESMGIVASQFGQVPGMSLAFTC